MQAKRKLDWTDWLVLTILWGAVPLAVMYVVLGMTGMFKLVTSEVTAAWIQAFGSIAAIVAAVVIMQEQHRQQRAARVDDDVRKLENLGTSIFFCRVVGHELVHALNENEATGPLMASLRGHVCKLSEMPAYEAPTWSAGFQVAQIAAAHVALEVEWEDCRGLFEQDRRRHAAIYLFMSWLVQSEGVLRDECRKLGREIVSMSYPISGDQVAVFGRPEPMAAAAQD